MALGIFHPHRELGGDGPWMLHIQHVQLGAAEGIQPRCPGSMSRQQPCRHMGWLGGATGNVEGMRAPRWWWVHSRSALLSPQSLFDNKFDDIFGSSFSSDPFNFNSQNGMNKDDK